VRLILDTTVIVSSVRSDLGASHFLVQCALERRFDLLLSNSLALEYEDVLHRPEHLAKADMTHEQMEAFLKSLYMVGREISLGLFRRPNLPDPGDEHVLNLALRGRADGLVTQNARHFPGLLERFGVKLYSPREAARLLRS
jgi:predicted nucleic acid-binding protein